MKLAICSAGELFGGVERQILDLCAYFQREGGNGPQIILFNDLELASQLRSRGIKPQILKGRHRYDVSLIRQLQKVLEEQSIDVVHAHGYKATIACGLVKRHFQFRLVKTEHGKLEATKARPLAWLKTRMNFFLEQYFTREYVDHVCYVTRDIQNFFDSNHRNLARSTIYNGIDPISREDFPRPPELSLGRLHLGIVGRVSGVKGIPLAIEAMDQLRMIENLHLVIIGTGPQQDRLERLVEAKGLSSRVHFLGFKEEVFNYLANIDALLMPSYHEGLPYTLLEAMSLERPIIATSVGGLKECLKDGKTALLFPKGETRPLLECIKKLVADPGLATKLGSSARSIQSMEFTLAQMGNAYRCVYTDSMNISGKGMGGH